MTIGYGITLALAIGLLIAYLVMVKNKEIWLTMLYICVTVVNLGYLLLSMANTVEFAIFGNDVAYLGSVFLSMCMLLTIVRLCGFKIKKAHIIVCVSIGAIMFAIIATSGFLPWYYKSVSIETIDGSTKLVKEYGILHPVYLIYLLSYFASMIAVIIHSVAKKKIGKPKFAGFIAGIVCSNIIVYATEWSSDADNHWHDATCKHEEEKSDLAAHTYTNACDTTCDVCGYTRTVGAHVYDNACDTKCNVCSAERTVEPHVYDNACDTTCNNCDATRTTTHAHGTTLTVGDTTHYYLCSVCGDKKDEVAHTFDKEVASSEFLKAEATATTKAQYYKSCVCGAKSATEYFETDKTTGTLANIQDLSKTYDKVELANPTYETNSDGAVTIEWYQGDTKLDSKPVNAGTYKVKVIIAESATYTGISAEKEFTIAKKVLSGLTAELTYANTAYFEVTLGEANGIVADDVADNIKVCITFANKNVGAAVTGAGLDAEDGDNYTNYELDLTTCTANIVKRPVWAENVEFTYDGYDIFCGDEYPVFTLQNVVSGETIDLGDVSWRFDSKNAGATLTAVELSEEYNPNYTIDFSKCTASIVPKVIDNLTYKFKYNGSEYQSVTFEDDDIPGIIGDDSLFLEVCFATPDVGAALDTSEETGFEPGFAEENYVLGENYSFSIVPKALTGSIFFDLYYGDVTKVEGRELYYYDYEITEEEYGVVNGDSVTLRALYESPNAGTVDTSCGLYMENNYVMGTLNVNNTIISAKTIELPEKQYIAEYTGSSKLTLDLSEYAEYGETLEMYFTAMAGTPLLPVSAVGEYANNVSFSKINYSDATNYEIILPDSYSLKIAPKKITNLDLKVTYDIYNNMYITLLTKDGIVAGENVKLMVGHNYPTTLPVGTVLKLQQSTGALHGEDYEVIVSMLGDNKANYELVAYEDENGNMIYGKMTIVANCDVQYDGSCSCGTSHLTETLTFTGGEAVGNSATIACDSTYEGGIYKIALEGGTYEFFGTDQFFNISGIYDANGNMLAKSIGTYALPQGTYYFHVYVGSNPYMDTIWVKKTGKMLDIENEEIIVTQITNPNDLSYRDEEIADYHSGGDRFVLFYSRNEEDDVLGCSITFYYADDEGEYLLSAEPNIEDIEFYDINGRQLPVTYEEPDMIREDGVTAIGGVYIVITMNGEGEHLRFGAC